MERVICRTAEAQLSGKHKKCCTAHGVCYVFRKPWAECDKEYCDCVYKIAGKAGGTCQVRWANAAFISISISILICLASS